MVKRQSRSYLDAARAEVLAQLQPGERTPIFKLGEQRLERYSWYLRLSQPRRIDGSMAGIRLEVAASGGLGGRGPGLRAGNPNTRRLGLHQGLPRREVV